MAGLNALVLGGGASAQTMTPPPAEPGTVAYNEWLGGCFSGVLLDTPGQAERVKMVEKIVAVDYGQHNPMVPEGRQGLIDFLPVIHQVMPDV